MSNGDFYIKNEKLLRYYGSETDVIIPDNVSRISNYAFEARTDITSITFPKRIAEISYHAFDGCVNLKKLHFTGNIPDLYSRSFKNCTGLTQLDFAVLIKGINFHAFQGCSNIREILFPENDKEFDSLFRTYETHLLSCEHRFALLASLLEKKFDYVKNNEALTRKMRSNKAKIINIAIKTNRPEIIENLFALCKKIKLDELDEYIASCKDSTAITAFLLDYKSRCYPPEVQEKHENTKLEKELGLKNLTLADWRRRFELKFYDKTVTIKRYKGRDSHLVIPEEINKHKVDYIHSLSSKELQLVHIPDSVTRISDSCFDGCTGLADENGFVVFRNKLYNYFGTETDVEIPEGVTEIGNYAFQGCSEIKSITVPDSITKIGGQTFRDCTSLESINFKKTNI